MFLKKTNLKKEALSLIIQGLTTGKELTLTASGISMQPLIIDGDKMVIDKINNTPRVGDIVAYYVATERGHQIIVHRVIAVSKNGSVKTQGDNAPEPDPGWVSPGRIIGKVKKINKQKTGKEFNNGEKISEK